MYYNYLSNISIPPIHPLMPATIFYILGILCAYALPLSLYSFYSCLHLSVYLGVCLGIAVCISTAIAITFRLPKLYIYTSILSLGLFGAGFYRYYACVQKYTKLKQALVHKQIIYTGVVQALEKTADNYYKQCLTLNIITVKQDTQIIATNPGYSLKCYYAQTVPVTIGDTLEITSSIKYTHNTFEKYLLKESLLAYVFLKDLKQTCIVNNSKTVSSKFLYTVAHMQDYIARLLQTKMSPLTYTLFCSLFLGKKSTTHQQYKQSIKDLFANWGIVHYLARSGLHIVLIIALWSMMLGLLPLPYFIKQALLACFIVLYYIFTWPSISFIRACITFLLYKLCLVWSRPTHSFYTITLTCLLVLLYNPLQLFFLDFQLSFGLTALLAWFNETRLCKAHKNS